MKWLILPLFILLVAVAAAPPGRRVARRPNIIVIMADDMGFSDAGCYGGEIRTPNLDYLAENGIRYTQFYNTSRCCPTRASLLTGLYNQQAGIGKMTDAEDEPGYLGHIGNNAVTLAEVLRQAGYHTAMCGKWHVANTNGLSSPQGQMDWLDHHVERDTFTALGQYPTNRGFEKYFGTIWGVVDYYDPFSLVSGTTPVRTVPKDYYHTDAINDTAVAYIEGYANSTRPFFLYVAENAPHWPLQARPEDIERYKNTYKGGWDVIRKARYDKMALMGLIDPVTTPLSGRWQDNMSWDRNPDTAWDAMAMAVHAAMIDRMDQGIGRIIGALRQIGQLDNTLIVFLSDNGASAGATYPRQYKGHAILPTTGISLVPTFRGEARAGHAQLFNEHYGARYAREKDWKLVALSRDTSHWQLYDLATDGSETKDVAAEHPEEVRRLDSLWWGWARSHQVYPKPGRK
jgi:arylsulfatase